MGHYSSSACVETGYCSSMCAAVGAMAASTVVPAAAVLQVVRLAALAVRGAGHSMTRYVSLLLDTSAPTPPAGAAGRTRGAAAPAAADGQPAGTAAPAGPADWQAYVAPSCAGSPAAGTCRRDSSTCSDTLQPDRKPIKAAAPAVELQSLQLPPTAAATLPAAVTPTGAAAGFAVAGDAGGLTPGRSSSCSSSAEHSSSAEDSSASLQPSSSDSSNIEAVQAEAIVNGVGSSRQQRIREHARGHVGLFGLHHRHGRQHDTHVGHDAIRGRQHHHRHHHSDKEHRHHQQPSRAFSTSTLQLQYHRGPQALAALPRHGHGCVQRVHVSAVLQVAPWHGG
jgi:hypothetical protein